MVSAFLDKIEQSAFLDRHAPVVISRAPGRLDVMGGIADYSGSLVLQRPIAEGTFVAVQPATGMAVEIVSLGEQPRKHVLKLSDMVLSYAEARRSFLGADDRWASYVAGVLSVLVHERSVSFGTGMKILISSEVPEAKGVASSAALEVAVMQAVAGAFDIHLAPHEMAKLCQLAENLVAGAPCGIMDQMTSACGEAESLLALLCQPAELQPFIRVPEGVTFWGLDSGERHAVSGSDYTSVRTGAFMGYRILAETAGAWGGYLANISIEEFESDLLHRLPDEMLGSAFLARYSGTPDTVTTVDPVRMYKIRTPTAHPVYENHRVNEFRALLLGTGCEEGLSRLGELMYESHASYSACGLGSAGTDLIVKLVREARPQSGLYGARITGGGSGGTVAVLGRSGAESAIRGIMQKYEDITGYRPYLFSGSSDGAAKFGIRRGRSQMIWNRGDTDQ